MVIFRRVVGKSMLPTLCPGNVLVAIKTNAVTRGDIVVARVGGQEVVKRVKLIDAQGQVYLQSDSSLGTDSRTWGMLPKNHVCARVVLKI